MMKETVVSNQKPIGHDYFQYINQRILEWIPPDSGVVLDVGCGVGKLGEKYKQVNPLGRYWGMELDQTAAKEAARRLDKVWCGKVDQLSLPEIGIQAGEIDCLVYVDSLAYMEDPWGVLARHVTSLPENGIVLASIPNGQYWQILSTLFCGFWDYTIPAGVSNRIPLRFFTEKSIQEMFTRAGLTLVDIKLTELASGIGYQNFLSAFLPAAQTLGLPKEQFESRTAAAHYMVRAVKQTNVDKPKLFVQSYLGETAVCSRVRITEPGLFLATIPGVVTEEQQGTIHLQDKRSSESKVFIWQRIVLRNPQELCKQRAIISRGYLTIAEIDDDPLRWEKDHRDNDFLSFRGCHAIQTSTQPLADFLRQFNPHVAVFPNQLAILPKRRLHRQPWPVKLCFAALNREQDWQPIMPILNQILKFYGDKVHIRVAHDKLFFNILETEHKEFIPFCPYESYLKMLYTSDINLLPLQPTRFNSMKSDLKFIESAGCGTVALASPTVYGNSIQHAVTGVIFQNALEFGKNLALLIENHSLRWQIADNAYNWVATKRMLSQHYRERYNWYLAMYRKLPALNDALCNRVPALFDR